MVASGAVELLIYLLVSLLQTVLFFSISIQSYLYFFFSTRFLLSLLGSRLAHI